MYHVKCSSCNASYVGETMRNINDRMSEHANMKSDSEVAKHMANWEGHSFNLDKPEILAFSENAICRRIKEALFIQKLKPSLNIQERSYKLFLFDVPN